MKNAIKVKTTTITKTFITTTTITKTLITNKNYTIKKS